MIFTLSDNALPNIIDYNYYTTFPPICQEGISQIFNFFARALTLRSYSSADFAVLAISALMRSYTAYLFIFCLAFKVFFYLAICQENSILFVLKNIVQKIRKFFNAHLLYLFKVCHFRPPRFQLLALLCFFYHKIESLRPTKCGHDKSHSSNHAHSRHYIYPSTLRHLQWT